MKPNITKYAILFVEIVVFIIIASFLRLGVSYSGIGGDLLLFKYVNLDAFISYVIARIFLWIPYIVVIYYSEKYYLNQIQSRWLLLKLPLIGILTSALLFFIFIFFPELLFAPQGIHGTEGGMAILLIPTIMFYYGIGLLFDSFIIMAIILFSYKNTKVSQFIGVLYRGFNIIIISSILDIIYIIAISVNIYSCGTFNIIPEYFRNFSFVPELVEDYSIGKNKDECYMSNYLRTYK